MIFKIRYSHCLPFFIYSNILLIKVWIYQLYLSVVRYSNVSTWALSSAIGSRKMKFMIDTVDSKPVAWSTFGIQREVPKSLSSTLIAYWSAAAPLPISSRFVGITSQQSSGFELLTTWNWARLDHVEQLQFICWTVQSHGTLSRLILVIICLWLK